DSFDVATKGLQTAIGDTGQSFAAVKPQIEDSYSKMANLGFENTEVANSLQKLSTATKSPTKALEDESLAANLARAQHESLGSATEILTKIYAGSTRALTQLGVNLNIQSAKLKTIQSE